MLTISERFPQTAQLFNKLIVQHRSLTIELADLVCLQHTGLDQLHHLLVLAAEGEQSGIG